MSQRLTAGGKAVIATAHDGATQAGLWALRKGGNAIDAAVAAAFALGVCEPAASGLGGQGMAILHHEAQDKTIAVDGSSRAPLRALCEDIGKKERLRGHRATTVPSTPAMLGHMVVQYGELSLAQVLKPAIVLAQDGFAVGPLLHQLMRRERTVLIRHGAARLFLEDGHVPRLGATLRQPVLAATLERLAAGGLAEFYHGETARRIAADMAAHGGLLAMDDLAEIPVPVERKPVRASFRGMRLRTMPPPGAGRTLAGMLNVVSQFKRAEVDSRDPEGAVLLARVMRAVFQERWGDPSGPAHYGQRTPRLTTKAFAGRMADMLRHSDDVLVADPTPEAIGETTHLSVIDAQGNAVALTQSIERVFGACAAAPDVGFLYNDYISTFVYDDPSHPYYLRPRAVPFSTAAPTLGFDGDGCSLAIGSPGSERICTALVQVLMRLGEQDLLEAIDAPRIHAGRENKVSLESPRIAEDVHVALAEAGFEVDEREGHAFYMGCVQAVARRRGRLVGVADPRREGSAGAIV